MIRSGESQLGLPVKHRLSRQTKSSVFYSLIKEKISKDKNPMDAIKSVRDDLKAMQSNKLFEIVRLKRVAAQKDLLKVSEESEKDALTGLYSRRYLMGTDGDSSRKGKMEELVERTLVGIEKGEKLDLSVALLDIDYFKIVNDTHGHATGDEVLRKVASVILENLRDTDIAARYGGEEIVIVIPENIKTAHKIIERIRIAISQIDFSGKVNYPKNVTASFGLTNLTIEGGEQSNNIIGESVIKRADEAMYESKHAGRNKITARRSKKEKNDVRVNEIVEFKDNS